MDASLGRGRMFIYNGTPWTEASLNILDTTWCDNWRTMHGVLTGHGMMTTCFAVEMNW